MVNLTSFLFTSSGFLTLVISFYACYVRRAWLWVFRCLFVALELISDIGGYEFHSIEMARMITWVFCSLTSTHESELEFVD